MEPESYNFLKTFDCLYFLLIFSFTSDVKKKF